MRLDFQTSREDEQEQPNDQAVTSSLTQDYPLRLSEFARFSACDFSLSACLSASLTDSLSQLWVCLQISSDLTSTPTLLLGPPTPNQRTEEPKVSWEVSALGQRFLWTQGESCAGEVWKECALCPGAKCSRVVLPASASLPAWGGVRVRALWVWRGRGMAPAATQGIPSSSLPGSYWPRAPPPPAARSSSRDQ